MTLAELQALMASGGVRLVEALGPSFFADVRLPGAVNIPPQHASELAPLRLPDLHGTVVVYCSATCSSAEETAARLVALGYDDVRLFPGGKEEWVEAGLPVERDPPP